SLDEERSKENFDSFQEAVEVLQKHVEIFNKRDFLLKKLETYDGKIIRPMLATLTLYSKIFLQQLLLESDMIEDKAFDYYFHKYFPKAFVARFDEKLSLHPLKKEIVALIVSNKIINATGSTFISDFDELGADKFLMKIKSYLILNRLFDATDARKLLFASDFTISTENQYRAFISIENSIAYALNSMIELDGEELNFTTILSYKGAVQNILEKVISNHSIKFRGLDVELNFFLNMIGHIKFIAEILKIEFSSTHTFHEVIEAFFCISKKLKIVDFVMALENKELTHPNDMIIKNQLDTIVRSITAKATKDLLDFKRKDELLSIALDNYFKEIDFDIEYFNILEDRSEGLSDISIAVNYLTVKISK
ncbi:NAD-glutamate dehydrogenase, partial [Sulfurovum sp. bin170]|uniref:NAD-glutamate dehydrogenase domain-containing protein n=1 Tax=Sulfurovum sp. bin170 TaxID=2695268 RepID=UPI0013DF689B